MKNALFFALCFILLSASAYSGPAQFDLSTMSLEIPCVRLVPAENSETCYPVTLILEQSGDLSIGSVGAPVARAADGDDATFDMVDLTLSIPRVSVAGVYYKVKLLFTSNKFLLVSIKELETVGPNNQEYRLMGSCGNDMFGICADFYSTETAEDVVERAQLECANQLGTWSDKPCNPNFIKKCVLVKNAIYEVTSYLYNKQSESFFDGLCASDMSQLGTQKR